MNERKNQSIHPSSYGNFSVFRLLSNVKKKTKKKKKKKLIADVDRFPSHKALLLLSYLWGLEIWIEAYTCLHFVLTALSVQFL